MSIAIAIGFLFGFIGSMPVAGPIAVLVFARGLEQRARAGFGIAIGGALAEGVYACLAFWGFAEFLASYPVMLPISRALAAVVLGVLGVSFILRKATNPESSPPREGWGSGFVLGFTITALNPTLIATWTAATTTLYSTGLVGFDSALALPFGLSAAVGIIAWFALLLYLIHRFRESFSARTLNRIIQAMGVMLVGLAGWFLYLFIDYLVQGAG